MRILIDTDCVFCNNLTTEEVLTLLMLYIKGDKDRATKTLTDKGFITQDGNIFKEWRITENGVAALNNLIYDSDKKVPKRDDKRLNELADKLREIYPKGRMQGQYSWRGTHKEIVDKLRKFFFKYGDKFTDEEIVEATQKYVKMKEGSETMRLLKYFIWKKDLAQESEVSDLADMLENGEDEEPTSDWKTNMV